VAHLTRARYEHSFGGFGFGQGGSKEVYPNIIVEQRCRVAALRPLSRAFGMNRV
jgi:hypothetical protein